MTFDQLPLAVREKLQQNKAAGSFDILGVYLGYPGCCIDAFPAESHRNSSFNGTGFLPCMVCAQLPHQELLNIINNNRIHHEPFPTKRLTEEEVDSIIAGSRS